MITADALRVPAPADPSAPAYKDWLHLNVFDYASGAIGLVNTSLHGPPGDRRTRVVGTALFDVPHLGWVGNLSVRDLPGTLVSPTSIALDTVALAVHHPSGTLAASATLPGDGLDIQVRARAASEAFSVERRLPLGPGWISWYVVPRLHVNGTLRAGTRSLHLEDAGGYHDHNWGRWHWGADFGWDWGTFHTPRPGPTVVLARTTDRLRRRSGPYELIVDVGGGRHRFAGTTVQVQRRGRLQAVPRRLPGAMAALRADRARPHLPATVVVRADDGTDHLDLHFTARACAQLVLADPIRAGQSFLHEVTGAVVLSGRVRGAPVQAEGLGIIEYVD